MKENNPMATTHRSTRSPEEYAAEIRKLVWEARRDETIADALAAEMREKFGETFDADDSR
jgi:hypothetical protein